MDDKEILLRTAVGIAKEKVIQAALKLASTAYNEIAEDPGWEQEMYEEMLDGAIRDYVTCKNTLSLHQKGEELPKESTAFVTFPVLLKAAFVDEPDELLVDQDLGTRTVAPGDRLELKVLLNRDGTINVQEMRR